VFPPRARVAVTQNKRAARNGAFYCAFRTVFPQGISGLRKPIAIQAAISFSMNLPE